MADPRVIVAMAHTSDYMPLAALTVPTVRNYCDKHGYAMYYCPNWEERFPNDGDRMKVRVFKELYEQHLWDVFVWIDSDAMIMNSDRTVNELLDNMMVRENQHFLWGYDVSGPNTGVYIARFTWEAHMFMHASFALSVEMGWGDNTAMIQKSLVPPFDDWIACVPGRYMNAYDYDLYGWGNYKMIGDWRTAREANDDWIIHFPGIETFPNAEHPERPNRIDLAKKYLLEAK